MHPMSLFYYITVIKVIPRYLVNAEIANTTYANVHTALTRIFMCLCIHLRHGDSEIHHLVYYPFLNNNVLRD